MSDYNSVTHRPHTEHRGRRLLRDLVVIVVVAVWISLLTKAFLVRSFYIPSGSMQETLQINDRIVVNELVPDLIGLDRGDIVVFTDPGGWLASAEGVATRPGNPVTDAMGWLFDAAGLGDEDATDHLVKRVIGLPGDRVACCDASGRTTVNGEPITEPYLKLPPGTTRASENDFSVTVPAESLWVEGDNRYNSADSRLQTDTPSQGFVPVGNVVGRVFVVNWPLSRWSWLDD
ncbi:MULTISPECIES: signal peptidase I [Cryobacterium]|uniref:Signal peptidase I n=1 Tax=Cryobacterium breve TaxID=1259258 RepID=A0ABY2J0R3_9MICO|nr:MULTISPECIES: signal peptidase I [Cryobacterium]TFC97008.1 signal peptidase I [Cryobacterium sp. TmT3-12]TFC97196.1 signal peptidase I [Cryobacterium breve]